MRFFTALRAVVLAVLPMALARPLVNRMGYSIHRTASVGVSWITIDRLEMGAGSRIGHLNRLTGPYSATIGNNSKIGHQNIVSRAPLGVSVGKSVLSIGNVGGITSRHFIDLTSSVTLGNFTTVAGSGTHLWTHGYIHDTEGAGRYRVDGEIQIGNNVYIGAMCFVSMGVTIADGVIVGGGTAVARDLTEAGLYVSSAMRKLPRPIDPDQRADLDPIPAEMSVDRVYRKR